MEVIYAAHFSRSWRLSIPTLGNADPFLIQQCSRETLLQSVFPERRNMGSGQTTILPDARLKIRGSAGVSRNCATAATHCGLVRRELRTSDLRSAVCAFVISRDDFDIVL
jgi:hypothetical protein